jgi:hypothetical protein
MANPQTIATAKTSEPYGSPDANGRAAARAPMTTISAKAPRPSVKTTANRISNNVAAMPIRFKNKSSTPQMVVNS